MADSGELKRAVLDRSHRMLFQINTKSRAGSPGFMLNKHREPSPVLYGVQPRPTRASFAPGYPFSAALVRKAFARSRFSSIRGL